VLRVGRVEREERVGQLLGRGSVEARPHRPVVVVVGGRGGQHAHLGRVRVLGLDQLLPHRRVEHARIGTAGRHEGDRGVVRARIRHRLEIALGVDLGRVLHEEVARHQAARGGRWRAERKGAALQVGQRLRLALGRHDELAGEHLVLCALHDRHRLAVGAQLGLHKGEAAQPGQIDLVGGQPLDHRRVVGHGRELHLHARGLRQIVAERLELALQLGGGFVGDGGDAEHGRRLGVSCQRGEAGGGQEG